MIYVCTYININCINEYIWSLRKIVEGVTCCSYGASSTGTGSICFELNLSCYWFSFFPLVLSFSPFSGFACSSFHEIIHALWKTSFTVFNYFSKAFFRQLIACMPATFCIHSIWLPLYCFLYYLSPGLWKFYPDIGCVLFFILLVYVCQSVRLNLMFGVNREFLKSSILSSISQRNLFINLSFAGWYCSVVHWHSENSGSDNFRRYSHQTENVSD